ncbi:lysosomal acid lipase-related [Holotrichia oblita]|uniref:Lysosomal acid lipase-related n=1 Tax=Holotrichia oblita TaxID=644536 RepID=A0ACB9TB96_HOLOL|nr:lysosomal acid lipase-related [Holotrichia oblita]
MKILIASIIVVFAAFCVGIPHKRDANNNYHGNDDNITDVIKHENYRAENYTVLTFDGYLLDLIRVSKKTHENHEEQDSKPAVLLMHGLSGSAHDFVAGGATHGLAYKLADNGLDVFLGNARGSRYGLRHLHLNPKKDGHFWRYCWDDIGIRDLPAIIDKILKITGQNQISYVGYNQGNTIFYVMASVKPEYNAKVSKMVALAPLAYIQHAQHPLMTQILQNKDSKSWVIKNIGQHEFSPSNDVVAKQQNECIQHGIERRVCEDNYFILNNISDEIDQDVALEIVDSEPRGCTSKQLLHYAQIMETGRFAPYASVTDDDDSSSSDDSDSSTSQSSEEGNSEDEYRLERVTVPHYIFDVPRDNWYSPEDLNKLKNRLPSVEKVYEFPQYYSNVDLLLAKDAHHRVHEKIVDILKK